MQLLWLIKILTAHLLTDFVLQPKAWVTNRIRLHWKSKELYLHAVITALVAWLFTGFDNWFVPVIIFITHLFIDLWKSYRPENIAYFFIDQCLHLAVIVALWLYLFPAEVQVIKNTLIAKNTEHYWSYGLAVLFLTQPAGIIIGILTQKWRDQVNEEQDSLSNAGKWIGILERVAIFFLVINNQFAAIGLLTAAKSILRIRDGDGARQKTEYVLIGTLISVTTALLIGLIIRDI